MNDNSFKLFATEPDIPDMNKDKESTSSEIVTAINREKNERLGLDSTSTTSNPGTTTTATTAGSVSLPNTPTSEHPPQQQVIKGPWRLLRLLPGVSRPILGQMLKLDPKKRATMDQIMKDEWIQSLAMCTIAKTGELMKGNDHQHTVVPQEQAHLESYKK